MGDMMKLILFVFLAGLSVWTHAADVPEVVVQDENFNQELCVDRAANDCINTVCLTSSERDCQETCQSHAEDKCEEMAQE